MVVRRVFLACGLTMALVFAGCGGGDKDDTAASNDRVDAPTSTAAEGNDVADTGTPGAGDKGDACDLFSEDEAEAIFGGEFDLTSDDVASSDACSYVAAGDDITEVVVVTLQVARGSLTGGMGLSDVVKASGAMLGEDDEPQPVAGLGDEAVMVGGTIPMLFVADGADLVTVSIMGLDDASDAMEQMASSVLSRL